MDRLNTRWRRRPRIEMEELNASILGPVQDLPKTDSAVIVGGGSAGPLAANVLGQLSVDIVLIEKAQGSGFALVGLDVSEAVLRAMVEQAPWPEIAPALVSLAVDHGAGPERGAVAGIRAHHWSG